MYGHLDTTSARPQLSDRHVAFTAGPTYDQEFVLARSRDGRWPRHSLMRAAKIKLCTRFENLTIRTLHVVAHERQRFEPGSFSRGEAFESAWGPLATVNAHGILLIVRRRGSVEYSIENICSILDLNKKN